ncbi:MAG: ABC transporter substrate-binding protein [Chloroflexi bacterium]|nr:ABC transporter substrate-binding protein [Chloroflexota bacterium]
MKTMRVLVLVLLAVSLLLAACGPAPTPTPVPTPVPPTKPPAPTVTPVPPTKAPEATKPPVPTATPVPAKPRLKCATPIKIGLITDKSGALAVYGAMTERAFLLGWEYLAGAPGKDNVFKVDDCEIQITVADDKGVVATTATVARELIEVKKVDILVGTVSSGSTATLQGIAKENKKVLVVAPAASNDITGKDFNEYTFRTSRNNYQDFINLCQYLTTRYKKFVQIAPDYAFGYGGAASARDACTKFGGTFVIDDIFAPLDTKEFTPYMDKILKSGAEAWIVTWAGAGFIPMFNTAKELGVLDKMALAASIADNATVPIYAPALGQNSGILYHYTLPKNPINDWLVEQVKARHKVPPDLFDADAMNAAIFIKEALMKTGGSASADVLIKAMEGLEFNGPKGKVYIRPEDHVAIQDMYIVKILNVTDKDFKFFELVTTTRPEPPCLLPEALKARCGKLPYGNLSGK